MLNKRREKRPDCQVCHSPQANQPVAAHNNEVLLITITINITLLLRFFLLLLLYLLLL